MEQRPELTVNPEAVEAGVVFVAPVVFYLQPHAREDGVIRFLVRDRKRDRMNKESPTLTDEEDEAHLLLQYTKIVCCATMFPYSPAAPGSETLLPPGRKSSFPNRSLLLLCFSFPGEEPDAEIGGTLSQDVWITMTSIQDVCGIIKWNGRLT